MYKKQLFARRVQARLSRWGLEADSSAGAPLSITPVGVLLSLMADLVGEPFSSATLLALLKHPLVRLGRGNRPLGCQDSGRDLQGPGRYNEVNAPAKKGGGR